MSHVDTKNETAMAKVGIVFYWTVGSLIGVEMTRISPSATNTSHPLLQDERLKGWDKFLLPEDLWGPEAYLLNNIRCLYNFDQARCIPTPNVYAPVSPQQRRT